MICATCKRASRDKMINGTEGPRCYDCNRKYNEWMQSDPIGRPECPIGRPEVNYSEFEKRTIVILAAMHYKQASEDDSHEHITLADESLSAVLSSYNIALDDSDPLWDELVNMTYGVQL
jgi:hypothetical protein